MSVLNAGLILKHITGPSTISKNGTDEEVQSSTSILQDGYCRRTQLEPIKKLELHMPVHSYACTNSNTHCWLRSVQVCTPTLEHRQMHNV